MKKSKFIEEQIAFALRMEETGTRVAEVFLKIGIAPNPEDRLFLSEEYVELFAEAGWMRQGGP